MMRKGLLKQYQKPQLSVHPMDTEEPLALSGNMLINDDDNVTIPIGGEAEDGEEGLSRPMNIWEEEE